MALLIDLADQAKLPDRIIRIGIRSLDRKRLKQEKRPSPSLQEKARQEFIRQMKDGPIAIETGKANDQHYELPPEFFVKVLGNHLKYSACYWPERCSSLDEAEAAMLALTCRRASLADGMEILELGCGWGSLTLWMADYYSNSRITAVSNSAPQREFIQAACRRRGLKNVTVVTADMNHFITSRRFDRVVSVEMFEHMRNWQRLLKKVRSWLKPDGRTFIHIFSHRRYAYPFETGGAEDWMGTHFFSGGIMPSDDLIDHFADDMIVEKHWRVNGMHYYKTAQAWLANLDRQKNDMLPIMAGVYGDKHAALWLQRWRIFFMACAELWRIGEGREWIISHYRLRPAG